MGNNCVERHRLPFSMLLAVPCHSGHALGSSNLSAISALRSIAKHADTNPRKHLTTYNQVELPDTGTSKSWAPGKHPLCPSARLKTESMISVRGYQTTLLTQKSPAAAGKRWCQHGEPAKKDGFGYTLVLISHLRCGDMKSQQFRCENTDPGRKLGLVGCSNPRSKTGLELRT